MGMTVFLTGASGYLGSVLTTHLANLPEVDGITGTYNSTTPRPPVSPKVSFVKLDVRSPELARAMAGHDVVIHTAFIVLWWARMPAATRDDICINGTRNVANAAISNRVQRFLYADTMLVDLLGSSGITLTRLRPTFITGPHDRALAKGFRADPVFIPGKNPRIQFVHEDDVASAFVQALSLDMPGAYNVVPDDFLRLREAYRLLGVTSGLTAPTWLARLAASIRWRYFGSGTHRMWLEALYGDTTFSNRKLRATGWAPRYDSAAALRSAL
jgi:UDP-glucose 4-epimerase